MDQTRARAGTCALPRSYTLRVGGWYWIGVAVGLGVALGVLAAGAFGAVRGGMLAAAVVAAAGGLALALLLWGWSEGVGGAAGGVAGALGASRLAAGTLRRGGTRGGAIALFGLAAIATAALAFVPALGYVLAVAVPALAIRLRARAGERYAGLRTLARD